MGSMTLLLVVAYLFANHALVEAGPCNASEYLDASSGACTPCSNCTRDGRSQYSPCLAERDAVCFDECHEGSFFNGSSCQTCSTCHHSNQIVTHCTATNNTVCDGCDRGYKYSEAASSCIIDCSQCQSGHCKSGSLSMCECEDSCMSGPLCDRPRPNFECTEDTNIPSETTPAATETESSSETSSFSPVTSALVAVGAVIGIVVFSVFFVLLGMATSCRKGTSPNASEGSNGSTDTQLAHTSSSLTSLYTSHHSPSSLTDYRTSIDFSNGGLFSHNSLRESPKLGRPLSVNGRNRDRVWTPV